MKKGLMLVVVMVLAATSGEAKGQSKTYDQGIDEVWAACVKAANSEFALEHSDKDSYALSFKSGISLTSNGFSVGVTLEKVTDGKTKVTVNPQKKFQLFAWGAGGRIANKFFKAVKAALDGKPPANDQSADAADPRQ